MRSSLSVQCVRIVCRSLCNIVPSVQSQSSPLIKFVSSVDLFRWVNTWRHDWGNQSVLNQFSSLPFWFRQAGRGGRLEGRGAGWKWGQAGRGGGRWSKWTHQIFYVWCGHIRTLDYCVTNVSYRFSGLYNMPCNLVCNIYTCAVSASNTGSFSIFFFFHGQFKRKIYSQLW